MPYAALISLKQTIQSLLNSPRVSISPPSREILDVVYNEAESIQKALKHLDSTTLKNLIDADGQHQLNAFYTEVREAACSLEDALENHFLNLIIPSQPDHEESPGDNISCSPILVPLDMSTELKQYIDSFTLTVNQNDDDEDEDDDADGGPINVIDFGKNIEGFFDVEEEFDDNDSDDDKSTIVRFSDDDDYVEEDDDVEAATEMKEEEEKWDVMLTRIHVDENKEKMVGYADIFHQIKDHLLVTQWPKWRIKKISLVGMAGIGKTTIATKVYEDASISKRFNRRVWVNVGQKYQFKDILESILSQVSPGTNTTLDYKQEDGYSSSQEDEEYDIKAYYPSFQTEEYDYFLAKRFYKMLEDTGRYLIVLDDIWDTRIFNYFDGRAPFKSTRKIFFLLTTRLDPVGASFEKFKPRVLTTEESFDLFCEKIFGDPKSCPRQLQKAGKKISENCEGLPLTVVTVASILSEPGHEMTPEYWNKVAEKESSVFAKAYDQISKVLYPSYEYLPQRLKPVFLYMAVFPQNYKIPVTRIGMLWAAEGFFVKPNYSASAFIESFVSSSLVLSHQSSYDSRLKVCAVHSVFWHLCVRVARENKLFHVLKKHADSSSESIRNQRRLCIHNNVLFGIKDARLSMSSISTARSLLCTGPLHRYPVPICSDLRLLRVIDALTIRFYEFPIEVVTLVQLRYLGLIYDGKLPATISGLWNLQFLIVRRFLSMTRLCNDETYLPIEIWDMKELKHLQVMGSDLLDPRDGACLPNLVTLLDASTRSCTKGVLLGLPKLEKLGFRIEAPVVHVDNEPFSCFDHISNLSELESVKCVVVNPELGFKVLAPPASSSLFPKFLKKLSLSGCGYSWEEMKAIASMPFLEVLKLRWYAFRGPKWEIKDEDFPSLRSLLIEDADLVHLIVGRGSFLQLECMILKNCYKLEEVHGEFFGWSFKSVEIIDCNPFLVNFAKQLHKDNSSMKLRVHSSWELK